MESPNTSTASAVSIEGFPKSRRRALKNLNTPSPLYPLLGVDDYFNYMETPGNPSGKIYTSKSKNLGNKKNLKKRIESLKES